jgi:hypothetical protein
MSLTTIRYDREQLERAVKTVEAQFPDKIERIRYSVGEDWADDPALFFRVLLKDSSDTQMVLRDEGAGRRVFDLSRLITDALTNEVHADDLQPYFAFRSVSEQEKLRDPKWD